MLRVEIIPARRDNYIYLLRDDARDLTAAIDPADAEPVLQALKKHNWRLTHIFCTHHHNDHIGGNADLKEATGCEVIGFAGDAHRIPAINVSLRDREQYVWGNVACIPLHIPGHTLGHVAYWLKSEDIVFCGDTLFSMGCGRLFEGTPQQMVSSLDILCSLPVRTRVYCGHEYTEQNGRFAQLMEPGNVMIHERMQAVEVLRMEGLPTLPSTIQMELQTNPFLRTQSAEIRNNLDMLDADKLAVFTELRSRKDRF